MLTQSAPLDLGDATPVAKGTKREVYLLPDHPDLVVKVLMPPEKHLDAKRFKRYVRRAFPSTYYRFLFREYHAYLDAKLKEPGLNGPLPVTELRGLVQTSRGVGMLAERVHFGEDPVGPNLHRLVRSGVFSQDHVPLLNDFVRRVYAIGLRANDINPGNIIFGTRDTGDQFVLVDGLGDSHLIPMRRWFDGANTRSLTKRFQRSADKMGLSWDAQTREFGLRVG